MPYKNNEDKLAAQRRWYAANREKVIAKVAERKRTLYKGTCRNCGGPTMGSSKNDIPEWCSKPECAREQRLLSGSERRRERIAAALAAWNVRDG